MIPYCVYYKNIVLRNLGEEMETLECKSGFTLMELMVYIALLGVIVLLAGQAFSDSSRMRVRSQNMLQASEIAENVAIFFKSDIAQTGAKTAMEEGVSGAGAEYGSRFSEAYAAVYMDPDNASEGSRDSSSFSVITKDGFDSLTVRRLRYDDNGHYAGIEQVAWFVENGSLWRSCKVLKHKSALPEDDPCADSAATEPKTVEMAAGVNAFKVIPSKPSVLGDKVQIFPSEGETEFRLVPRNDGSREMPVVYNERDEVNKGGNIQTVTNFYQNYDQTLQAVKSEDQRKFNEVIAVRNETYSETSWQTLCGKDGNHFTFEPGDEYEISFEMQSPSVNTDKSKLFVPGEDHMSVGLRDRETGDMFKVDGVVQLNDFLFFPPLGLKGEGSGARSMRFSVPVALENACLAFTFACYSPLVSQGKISFTRVKVSKIPSANYTFEEYDFEAHKKDKQNVKAFLLKLDIKNNGESGHAEVVVHVPSNGPRD